MARKPSSFTGAFKDWVPVKTSSKAMDSAKRAASKPDRVALEQRVVVEKYLGRDSAGSSKKIAGNPHGLGHSEFEVRTKNSGLDNSVNAKTFIVSKNKIIGSQG